MSLWLGDITPRRWYVTPLFIREWRLRGGEAASGQSSWNSSSCFSDRKADLHLAPCCVRLSQTESPQLPPPSPYKCLLSTKLLQRSLLTWPASRSRMRFKIKHRASVRDSWEAAQFRPLLGV